MRIRGYRSCLAQPPANGFEPFGFGPQPLVQLGQKMWVLCASATSVFQSHSVLIVFALVVASAIFASPAYAGEPSSDPVATKVIFVPFDFYPRHRDELGLNDEQTREMQRLSDQVRDSAVALEAERRERTKALQDAMAHDPIDPRNAMELFEAVVKVENELKALQFRNGIAMRNLLTPAQIAKLSPLATKDKASGIATTSGVLDEKLQQLRAEIGKRSHGGEPTREVVARVEQIEQLARQGRVAEAKTQIDEMLRDLRSEAGIAPTAGGKGAVNPPSAGQDSLAPARKE
jgi:Spy/CpxP family protein refolding chaperone